MSVVEDRAGDDDGAEDGDDLAVLVDEREGGEKRDHPQREEHVEPEEGTGDVDTCSS